MKKISTNLLSGNTTKWTVIRVIAMAMSDMVDLADGSDQLTFAILDSTTAGTDFLTSDSHFLNIEETVANA